MKCAPFSSKRKRYPKSKPERQLRDMPIPLAHQEEGKEPEKCTEVPKANFHGKRIGDSDKEFAEWRRERGKTVFF